MPGPARYTDMQLQALQNDLLREIATNTQAGFLASVLAGDIHIVGSWQNLSASEVGVFHLGNPATSGRILIIHTFLVSSDTSLPVTYYDDSTYVGTLVTPMNANQGEPVDILSEFRTGKGVPTGGAVRTFRSRVSSTGIPFKFDVPVVVPPGQSFAIAITAPSGLGAAAGIEGTAVISESVIPTA